jgi:hypothetical protein
MYNNTIIRSGHQKTDQPEMYTSGSHVWISFQWDQISDELNEWQCCCTWGRRFILSIPFRVLKQIRVLTSKSSYTIMTTHSKASSHGGAKTKP